MEQRKLSTETDGASSVIGIILLVALTVITAAVVGVFVLDGGTQQQTPNTAFSAEQDISIYSEGDESSDDLEDIERELNTLTITHEGGDSLDAENIAVLVNGDPAWGIDPHPDEYFSDDVVRPFANGQLSSGSSAEIVFAIDANVDAPTQQLSGVAYAKKYEEPPLITRVPLEDGGRLDANNNADELEGIQLQPDDTVTIVWTTDAGDRSAILFEQDIQ